MRKFKVGDKVKLTEKGIRVHVCLFKDNKKAARETFIVESIHSYVYYRDPGRYYGVKPKGRNVDYSINGVWLQFYKEPTIRTRRKLLL